MKHVSTPPFGRQPVTAGLLAAEALADTALPCPDVEKWDLLRNLIMARTQYGLSDRDLTVLAALLSFHPKAQLDGSSSLVVFPSNASLSARAHGMAESTLRRHLAALVKAGMIQRRDSPNRKRYARRSPNGAPERAYGFDLRPLLIQAGAITAAAEKERQHQSRLRQMREDIVIQLRDIRLLLQEQHTTDCNAALELCNELQKGLRRKPTLEQLTDLRTRLDLLNEKMAAWKSVKPSGNDSRNERHQQSSETEYEESEPRDEGVRHQANIPLDLILKAAPDIRDYAGDGIRTWRDLLVTAEFVRPMLGITSETWAKSCKAMGPESAAMTLACILQKSAAIRNPGGYLRKLVGKAVDGTFTPLPMVMALLRAENSHAL